MRKNYYRLLIGYNIKKDESIFQNDNDSKYRSKLVMNWFINKKIKLLDWPPQSSDLNPIENLLSLIKRRPNGYVKILKSLYQLWERVGK